MDLYPDEEKAERLSRQVSPGTRCHRLKRLKEVLAQVRDEGRPFDMASWVEDGRSDPPLLTTPVENCGTASCALGWAARDPVLMGEGLVLRDGEPVLRDGSWFNGFLTGSAFFGISIMESHRLFAPRHYYPQRGYITPDDVIERIDRLLKQYEC